MNYHNLLKGLILAAALIITPSAGAQSLSSVLSGIKSKVSSATSSSDVLSSLIGTKKVTTSQIKGTWKYSKPAVAFESDNLLNKAGGSVVSSTIENNLATQLSKFGVRSGTMTITFNSDSTFTATIGKKSSQGTYTLSGATIRFSYHDAASISANTKLSGNNLQITFTADKLLTFVKGIGTVGINSTALTTVSKLAQSYDGMQVGLQFAKSK